MPLLGKTGLDVFGLQLGGNPFGWTSDEKTSLAILDRFAAAGGNFIDTADIYSAWIPGNKGGESETIIGKWLRSRGNRDSIVIATKVGSLDPYRSLDRTSIARAVDDSLRRLGVDYIDLLYAHRDNPETPLEETLLGFDDQVRAGKVRNLGASNYSADRLREALELSTAHGLATYTVLQEDYSLVNRAPYEFGNRPVAVEHGLVNLPFRSLAKGFVAGKYRPGRPYERSTHTAIAESYLERYGHGLLTALDLIAERHQTTQAAVGLAWLRSQPTIVAPLSGARTVDQLEEQLPAATLTLSDAEVRLLTELTEPSAPDTSR